MASTCATGIDLSQTEFFCFFRFSISGLELDESQLHGENSKFCESCSYKGGKKGPAEDHPRKSLLLRICVTHRHMNFTMATMANQATEAAKGKNKPHFDNFKTYFGTFPSPPPFILHVINRKLRRSSQHGWLCVAWSGHRYRYAEEAMFSKRHFFLKIL